MRFYKVIEEHFFFQNFSLDNPPCPKIIWDNLRKSFPKFLSGLYRSITLPLSLWLSEHALERLIRWAYIYICRHNICIMCIWRYIYILYIILYVCINYENIVCKTGKQLHISAVRETSVSRHNPSASQYDSVVMVRRVSGGPKLVPHDAERDTMLRSPRILVTFCHLYKFSYKIFFPFF